MSFNVSGLSAYVSEREFIDDLWVSTMDYADTLRLFASGVVDVFANVKTDAAKLTRFSQTATFQDGANCTWNASGSSTFGQETITLVKYKINDEWCVDDLEDKVTAGYLSPGQLVSGLEDFGILGQYIVNELVKTYWNNLDTYLWTGSGSAGQMSGWNTRLAALFGTTVTTQRVSAGALSASNAYDRVEGLVQSAMAEKSLAQLVNNGGMTCFMGHDAFRYYDIDVQDSFGDHVHADPMGNKMHRGTNVVLQPVSGLTGTDFIYLVPNGNMVVLADTLARANFMDVGMDEHREKVWAKIRGKMGVGMRDWTFARYHTPSSVS